MRQAGTHTRMLGVGAEGQGCRMCWVHGIGCHPNRDARRVSFCECVRVRLVRLPFSFLPHRVHVSRGWAAVSAWECARAECFGRSPGPTICVSEEEEEFNTKPGEAETSGSCVCAEN